jgi:hypothetical protein
MQLGSVVYNVVSSGGSVTGANNGLELTAGIVQLGQTIGQGGSPANLLSNREVPLNGFNLSFPVSGASKFLVGSSTANASGAIMQVLGGDLAIDNTATGISQIFANTSNAEPYFRMWGGNGTTQLMVVRSQRAFTSFGVNAGGVPTALVSGSYSQSTSAFGFNCLASAVGGTTTNTSAFGTNALKNYLNNATDPANDAFGLNALEQLTGGGGNAAFGYQAFFNSITDNRNAGFGNGIMTNAGAGNTGLGATGSNNTMIGYNAGINSNLQYFTSTTTFNNCIIAGLQSGITTDGNALANTTLIGNGIFTNVNNVVMIGGNLTAQNIMLCATNNQPDLGSRVQIFGSLALPFNSVAVTTTLTNAHFTFVFTATSTATLPTAASSTNRIYCIVAQGAAVVTTSINYTNLAGASVNTVAAGSSVFIQSTGATWVQIK